MDVRASEIQAMKDLVDLAVGIPQFTYEMQMVDAPRPAGEYAAVKCTSSVNPGTDEGKIIDVNGQEMFRSRGIRILTFQILFSRVGDEYIKFDNCYVRPDILTFMRLNKLAALGKQALNLASITLETNWEFRQGLVAQFNVLREDLSPIGTMANAIVGGEFIDGDQVIQIKGI